MALTDMKMKSDGETLLGAEVCDKKPPYPCGLQIDLNDDCLTKLGYADLPKVGTTIKMVAEVEVTSVRQEAGENGNHRSVALQITKMDLSGDKEDSTENKLYGGRKEGGPTITAVEDF